MKLWRIRLACAGLLIAAVGALLAGELRAVPKPAPSEKRAPSDPVSDRERKNVDGLHRNFVEIFVDRPLFGVRRTLPTLFDDVVLPPKADAAVNVKKDAAPVPDKNDGKERDAHFSFQDLIDKHHRGFPADGEGTWQLRKVQLVGLIKHPKPVVYATDKVPGMKDAKEVPTRELDAFEKTALEEIQSGEGLRVERHGGEIRALGPIYAGKRCAACHEKNGALLGGFSYVLERAVPTKP